MKGMKGHKGRAGRPLPGSRSGPWRNLSARPRPLPVAALVVAIVAGLLPMLLQVWRAPSANAIEFPVKNAVTGNATWFDAIGAPYGGCGMSESTLESLDYIALNVFNTPGDYKFYDRPMPAGDSKIGMWNNGHNCGRWVEVEIGDYCTGVNDGAPGQAFCRNGEWVSDKYKGAKLNMIVTDSCGDSNAWCREDPYHIDLHKSSINKFVKDGQAVGDLADPEHWNNRHVSWKFIDPPNYSGDIEVGFLAGSKSGWTAVGVQHLPNGIHGMDYWFEDAWHDATMDGDMGQAFIVKPYNVGETKYSIRVRDINDTYVNDGRVYTFDLPKNCDPQCAEPYQKIEYTTSQKSPGEQAPPKTCTASAKITMSWPNGYQGEVAITAGESKIRGWNASWSLANGSLGDVWNGQKSVSGSTITVTNVAWNGVLAPGASTTFGFMVNGEAPSSAPAVTCAAS